RLRAPSFTVQIILGLVIGVLLGWWALSIGQTPEGEPNGLTVALDTVGSTFVSLLRATVPPLVFTAIVASIANLRGVANAARLAGQTLVWFAITAAASVAIGIGLGLVMQPGINTSVGADAAGDPGRTGSWLDFLGGLVPGNFLGLETSVSVGEGGAVSSAVSFNVLQILVMALVVGLAALKVGQKTAPFRSVKRSL